jgi:hypothetical protein
MLIIRDNVYLNINEGGARRELLNRYFTNGIPSFMATTFLVTNDTCGFPRKL